MSLPRMISITERFQSHAVARLLKPAAVVMALSLPAPAFASFLEGEALDTVADVMAWVVLVVVPVVAIGVFLLVHILPEKIAEKKNHPQAKAIQCLCLLSLAFGGLLWPMAWLWAYTKPVLHKLAYGTDEVPHAGHDGKEAQPVAVSAPDHTEQIKRLRQRIAELEASQAVKSPAGT